MGNDKAKKPAATQQPVENQAAPVAQQKPQSQPQQQGKGKVVQLNPDGCITEGCTIKAVRAGFCEEHYSWFKAGLVTKDGRRPIDFEKKFFHFQNRRAKSA